jgi:hypothetical protein
MMRSQTDHSVFYIYSGSMYVFLLVNGDDIILTDNDNQGIENLKHFLGAKFQIKDLGKLRYFFRYRGGLVLVFLKESIP